MKTIILILIVFTFISCNKKIECEETYDTEVTYYTKQYETNILGLNNSLKYNIISPKTYYDKYNEATNEWQKNLNNAKTRKYDCMKFGSKLGF